MAQFSRDKVTFQRGEYFAMIQAAELKAKAVRTKALCDGVMIGLLSALGGITFAFLLVIMGA